MGAIGFFLAAVAASTSLTAMAVGVLRRPMSKVLAELCGSRRRGDFWVTLASLCMLLAAAAAATFPDVTLQHPAEEPRTLLLNAILQVTAALAGVLLSLLVVVAALVVFVRLFEERLAASGGSPGSPIPAIPPGGRDPFLMHLPRLSPERSSPAKTDTLSRLRQRRRQLWYGDKHR